MQINHSPTKLAFVIVVMRAGESRFYIGKSDKGALQTAWSLAGATLFLDTDADIYRKAIRFLERKRAKWQLATVELGNLHPEGRTA